MSDCDAAMLKIEAVIREELGKLPRDLRPDLLDDVDGFVNRLSTDSFYGEVGDDDDPV